MTTQATTQKSSIAPKPVQGNSKSDFVFGKENYLIMLAGIAFIITGFVLMAGGGSEDRNVFSPEIFSTRRIVIAPIVVLIGFAIEFYAIFRKTKD